MYVLHVLDKSFACYHLTYRTILLLSSVFCVACEGCQENCIRSVEKNHLQPVIDMLMQVYLVSEAEYLLQNPDPLSSLSLTSNYPLPLLLSLTTLSLSFFLSLPSPSHYPLPLTTLSLSLPSPSHYPLPLTTLSLSLPSSGPSLVNLVYHSLFIYFLIW